MMDDFDDSRRSRDSYQSWSPETGASRAENSRRHGDEFIDDLIAQARSVKLPPPSVSPGFVLARAARKREQHRAFAAGFAGAVILVVVATNVVRSKLSSPTSPNPDSSVQQDRLAEPEEPQAVDRPASVAREGTCIPKPRSPGPGAPEPVRVNPPGGGALDTGPPQRFEQYGVPDPLAPAPPHTEPADDWTVETILRVAQTARSRGRCQEADRLVAKARELGASPTEWQGLRCTPSHRAESLGNFPPPSSSATVPPAAAPSSTAVPHLAHSTRLASAPHPQVAPSPPAAATPRADNEPSMLPPSKNTPSRLSFGGRK